jgi:hypothetical protein
MELSESLSCAGIPLAVNLASGAVQGEGLKTSLFRVDGSQESKPVRDPVLRNEANTPQHD